MSFKIILFIFLGSGLGGVSRFILSRFINENYPNSFPLGTLLVNILACLILGFVVSFADQKQAFSEGSKVFWTIGFCGGFSTFSTFSMDSLHMVQSGNNGNNILYIFASLLFCLLACFIGQSLAYKVA